MSKLIESTEEDNRFKLFRPLALLLEIIPLLFAVISYLFDSKVIFLQSMIILSTIYILGAWYLFKSQKYKWYEIILSSFFGFLLSIILIGLLFAGLAWEGYNEMMISSHSSAIFGIFFSLTVFTIKIISSKNKLAELRMSGKILLRFIIAIIIIHSTNLEDPFMNLFN